MSVSDERGARPISLPEAVRGTPFDDDQFRVLCAEWRAGALSTETQRLAAAPGVLEGADTPVELGPELSAAQSAGFAAAGRAAIASGRVALLIMAGGMATRFGGGAKGAVSIHPDHALSFLGLALRDTQRLATTNGAASIPVVVMTSFATHDDVVAHLDAIDWGGVPSESRHVFGQSLMPRIEAQSGRALCEREDADALALTTSFAAPGHGDTLGRLRDSGTLARLRERGVEHLLVANVDNLGARIDPLVLGAHLDAVRGGAKLTVEVVRRETGDAGGCVARLEQGPAIVEAFRLPEGVPLERYPHFNTNTLWFELSGLDAPLPLDWFAVRREAPGVDDETVEVVQFERLIGQASEFLPTAFVSVPRALRFRPIKTREDLVACAEEIEARISRPDDFALTSAERT